jgi:translation initiation factor 1
MSEPSRLVYSTDGGRVTPPKTVVGRRAAQAKVGTAPPDDGIVRIQRDKRGRGGKTATTVTGLPGDDAALDGILRELKQYCGAGGAREGRMLAIQGDQRERLQAKLAAMGYRVKLAGG